VLRESGAIDGAEIKSFSAAGLDGGLAGEVNRLELVYSGDGNLNPATVVAKLAHSDDEKRAFSSSQGLYEREVRFYQNLNSNVGIPAPTAYSAEHDSDSGYFILLLEDIGRYRAIDQNQDYSLADGKSAVQTLAKLRSLWWESEYLDEFDWLIDYRDSKVLSISSKTYNDSLERFLEIGGSSLSSGYESVARKYGESVNKVSGHFGKSPATLVHGDFRLANLMFDDRPDSADPVYAFDWQLATRGKGANDLGYFLGFSFSNKSRQHFEQQLLAEYHESILDLGVANYSFEEFSVDVRIGAFRLMYVLTLGIVNAGQHLKETDEGAQFLKSLCNRLQILVDWNCDEVIPN